MCRYDENKELLSLVLLDHIRNVRIFFSCTHVRHVCYYFLVINQLKNLSFGCNSRIGIKLQMTGIFRVHTNTYFVNSRCVLCNHIIIQKIRVQTTTFLNINLNLQKNHYSVVRFKSLVYTDNKINKYHIKSC